MDARDGCARYVIVAAGAAAADLRRDLGSLAEWQFASWVPARRRLLDSPMF
jgi:hypothetical protein